MDPKPTAPTPPITPTQGDLQTQSPVQLAGKLLHQPVIIGILVAIGAVILLIVWVAARSSGGNATAVTPYNCHKSWGFDGQPTLKLGDDDSGHAHQCVHELQFLLNKGLAGTAKEPKLSENGRYDHTTSLVVRDFQRAHHLTSSGQVGPTIWQLLRK